MLDLRSGGWVLLVAGLLMLATLAWRLSVILPSLSSGAAIGDGHNVASYGFDMSTCLVRPELIMAGGPEMRKDGLPAMVDPPVISAADMPEHSKLAGVRKMVSADRVIGVVVGGVARAYPLWVLNWHEVVNDTLAERAILVTYSPLCDAVVVFDRTVAGEVLEFGVSGLLYNSNLLMYDRRPDTQGESLWSQLQFRAISGPAAQRGVELNVLPSVVSTWKAWHARYPETTIVLPQAHRKRVYRRDAYLHYFNSDKLQFRVEPLPDAGVPLKTPIVATEEGGTWKLTRAEAFGLPKDWQHRKTVHAFWFAWHAMHPEAALDP